MGRIFRCPVESRVIANSDGVLDLFELIAGSADKLKLVKFRFESNAVAAEAVPMRLVRRSTTGSGGAAGTTVKNDETDSATTVASCTFDVTTPGTIGDILQGYLWEQLGPLEEIFLPEERPIVQEGGRICLEVSTVPTDSTMSGYVVWEEL